MLPRCVKEESVTSHLFDEEIVLRIRCTSRVDRLCPGVSVCKENEDEDENVDVDEAIHGFGETWSIL